MNTPLVWNPSATYSPQEFHQLCAQHDWTYQFSDDHRAWRAGVEQAEVLRAALNRDASLAPIYHAWVRHINSVMDVPRPLPPK